MPADVRRLIGGIGKKFKSLLNILMHFLDKFLLFFTFLIFNFSLMHELKFGSQSRVSPCPNCRINNIQLTRNLILVSN